MSVRENLEKLNCGLWQNERVSFKALSTETDLIYAAYECQLTDEQKELVNPAWFSIGRAYLSREDNYPCIIYNEKDERIGFINLCRWLGSGDAYSWSYFIDVRYQKMGYGRAAARLAVDLLKSADPKKQIKLSTEICNTAAQSLYVSLGFEKLDEIDGDDLVFGL